MRDSDRTAKSVRVGVRHALTATNRTHRLPLTPREPQASPTSGLPPRPPPDRRGPHQTQRARTNVGTSVGASPSSPASQRRPIRHRSRSPPSDRHTVPKTPAQTTAAQSHLRSLLLRAADRRQALRRPPTRSAPPHHRPEPRDRAKLRSSAAAPTIASSSCGHAPRHPKIQTQLMPAPAATPLPRSLAGQRRSRMSHNCPDNDVNASRSSSTSATTLLRNC